MKPAILSILVLFTLAGTAPAYAEEQATNNRPVESIGDVASVTGPETSQPAHGKAHGGQHGKGHGGAKHGGCKHGKGHGGAKHGGGQHGKGHGGAKHGGGQHGKGHGGKHGKGHGGAQHGKGDGGHDTHRQVVQRLDMLEARMAKIEAMLEILLRR